MATVAVIGLWPDPVILGVARILIDSEGTSVDAWRAIRPPFNSHSHWYLSQPELRAHWVATALQGLGEFVASGQRPVGVCAEVEGWLRVGHHNLEAAADVGAVWGAIGAFCHIYQFPFFAIKRKLVKEMLNTKFRAKSELLDAFKEHFDLPPLPVRKHRPAVLYATLAALGSLYKDEVLEAVKDV